MSEKYDIACVDVNESSLPLSFLLFIFVFALIYMHSDQTTI